LSEKNSTEEERKFSWEELSSFDWDDLPDDPEEWRISEVLALYIRYAYSVETLPHLESPQWEFARDLVEETLFVRDLLEDWIEIYSLDSLHLLSKEYSLNLPPLSELDDRLFDLYANNTFVRSFLDEEYRLFREEVEPPDRYRWWWFDRLLLGKQVH